MRLREPRFAPLGDAELGDDIRARFASLFEGGPPRNIYRTLLREPDAFQRFAAWGSYILSAQNSLPPRQREIVILRTGYVCRSGYEFAQHKRIGLSVGLSETEVDRIKAGPEAAGWSRADSLLIYAADELHRDQFIGDALWSELRRHFTDKQLMDLVFTAAQYTQVAMILNSFGVQLEQGVDLEPELAP